MSALRTPAARGLAAMALGLALVALPVTTVVACSCMQATIAESADFADVVFAGTVVAIEAPPPGEIVSTADPVRYSFVVDQVFKGPVTEAEIVASTAMDGASCGTAFGMDERWLVFATVAEGEIWTGLCSGNVLLADPQTEDAALAELGVPIAEPEPAPTEASRFEVPTALILALVAVVAVIGLSAWAFVIEPRRRVS